MRVPKRKLAVALVLALVAAPAWAGAKLKIDDESQIDLGFRVQTLYIMTDDDLDGDGSFESIDDFALRRGRIRLKGTINKHFSAFLQTETSGSDATVIDAYVNAKCNNWTQFIMGINMAPASRQNVTSSGTLMAIDRPGINYKTLTWGGRALHTFSTRTYSDSDSGFRGSTQVRDVGLTFFGSGDAGEKTHVKYYLGLYDGVQTAEKDSERMTGRVQVNLFDAEPGFYNSSTYFGKKKTVGFGLSVDRQSDVDVNTDYGFHELDVFVEWPAGDGSITAEAAFQELDFDDVSALLSSQGDGYYVQAGYSINKWQPWIEYEDWSSDDPGDVGSFTQYRLGVSYLLKGHNANIKLGYEKFEADALISGKTEDSIDSIVLGFYTTY